MSRRGLAKERQGLGCFLPCPLKSTNHSSSSPTRISTCARFAEQLGLRSIVSADCYLEEGSPLLDATLTVDMKDKPLSIEVRAKASACLPGSSGSY